MFGLLYFSSFTHAALNYAKGFQIFFPPGQEDEEVYAYTYLDIPPAKQYQTCLWFKSFDGSGTLVRLENEDNQHFSVNIEQNQLSIEDQSGVVASRKTTDVLIDIIDYRWHQLCIDCGNNECNVVLDNVDLMKTDKDIIKPVAGNYCKLVIGDNGFGGKVQDLEFGSSLQNTPLSSKTFCATQYKALGSDTDKFELFAEDLMVTRPIHIREHEVVCNDLLSVDCGIDSIFISVSHTMLKAIGEQYPIERLGLTQTCKNQTHAQFTTFQISPPEGCGGEAISELNDNVVRNSIFSLARDGQVFTADFSCRYPIDVTVIDHVSPALSNRVKTQNPGENVEIGLVRYESPDYKKLTKNPLEISGDNPVVHMAALIPDPAYRDRFVILEKCWTENQVLLDDFGCDNNESSFVYVNGAPNKSPRFSLRLPNWVVEFKCSVIYCEKDCELSCSAKRSRYGRAAGTDDLSTTPSTEGFIEQDTTESVFLPLETTPSPIMDDFERELFEAEKEILATKTKLTIKFGPLEWNQLSQPTTAATMAINSSEEEDAVGDSNKPTLDEELETLHTPETPLNGLGEEIEIVNEIEREIKKKIDDLLLNEEREEEEETSSVPGWWPIYIISGAGVLAFFSGFCVVARYSKCRRQLHQPKLLN